MKEINIFIVMLLVTTYSIQAQNGCIGNKKFHYKNAKGIGFEKGICRRDPSDVIKMGNTYYVYYTKVIGRSEGYWGTIWYAISSDGYNWKEQKEALGKGEDDAFDSFAVFTPNIIYLNGKYYLYYTGVRNTPQCNKEIFENNSINDYTGIGVAVSDSPCGPFLRIFKEPILGISTDMNSFDSYRVDDSALLWKDNKIWLYYKGRCFRDGQNGPTSTKMGVAFADKPEGPFVKHKLPLLKNSHEVMIWLCNNDVYALASLSSTIETSKNGLDFKTYSSSKKVINPPIAPGAYRPDLTNHKLRVNGIKWGISMIPNGNNCYLVRYEFSE